MKRAIVRTPGNRLLEVALRYEHNGEDMLVDREEMGSWACQLGHNSWREKEDNDYIFKTFHGLSVSSKSISSPNLSHEQ